MNQISELVQNNVTKLIIGVLLVVVIALLGFHMYAQFRKPAACIPTPQLSEEEKFWAGDNIVGGPKADWTQAKDASGAAVPNTFIFRSKPFELPRSPLDVIQKKKAKTTAPGYSMTVPEGAKMIAYVLDLNNDCAPTTYVVYGGKEAHIQGQYKITGATLHINSFDWDNSKAGKWGILDSNSQDATKLSFIGLPYKDPAPFCKAKNIGMIAEGLGNNMWLYRGKKATFTLQEGEKIDYWEPKTNSAVTATGPAVLDNIEAATIYCLEGVAK